METSSHTSSWAGTGSGPSQPDGDGREPPVQSVREHAGAVWDDAKATARVKLNEQKEAAADGLGNVAGALRDAAQRGRGGSLTGSAADGLERLSGTLRSKDVGALIRDVESFARQQPIAFLGLAVVVGFLGVRFLKASNT